MHGLSQIHLQSRGVVFKVKMAEDVLYNEVINVIVTIATYLDAYNILWMFHMQAMVYLIQQRYSISDYKEAVE